MRKVIVVQLLLDQYLETDGTTSYSFTDTDAKEIERLGPQIESLRAWVVLKNKTTNFGAAVHVTWSILGRSWATPVAVQADVTSNGETVGAEYSTSNNFCAPLLKILVGAHNTTGSARESGAVSAWLVVTVKS